MFIFLNCCGYNPTAMHVHLSYGSSYCYDKYLKNNVLKYFLFLFVNKHSFVSFVYGTILKKVVVVGFYNKILVQCTNSRLGNKFISIFTLFKNLL